MSGAGFAQTLVLGGLAQPEATRKQQQQVAQQVGMRISVQGLEQRFTEQAVAFMRELLERGLAEMIKGEGEPTLLPEFNGVYLTDCTRLVWSQGGVKVGVRWEVQQGQLQACVSELKQNDQRVAVIDQVLPPGALHLGDLGFFKLSRFARWSQQGVFWLSRFKLGTRLHTAEGQALDLLALLQNHSGPLVMPVQVGMNAKLPAYLLAAPLPAPALTQRQARLKEQARLDQRPLSTRQAAFAPWAIYLTNVPDLTFEQAHTLARTRWQIELLFKLWKSHGKLLVSRSADPLRQQCEGYAKLLGVLVAHWLLLVSGWRLDRLGLLDALRLVRAHLPLLMAACRFPALWDCFFALLSEAIQHAPKRSRRRKVPLAFQLWEDFALV